MAITTTLQPRYTFKSLLFIVLCLALGLWGVWDYTVKIPQRQRDYERWQTSLAVKTALETLSSSPELDERFNEAFELIKREMQPPLDRASERAGVAFDIERDENLVALYAILLPMMRDEESAGAESLGLPPNLREEHIVQLADALAPELLQDREARWVKELLWFNRALLAARRLPRTEDRPLQGIALEVYERTEEFIDETGEVTPPQAFDRMIQWAFILCLPFVPWYAFRYLQMRRVKYTLDDDGNLHSPQGVWEHDKIADIDMSRWMSKSIAEVVHEDGSRLKIDDYIHRDAHLIVGAIASEKHPEAWDAEAKKVKPEGEADEPGDEYEGEGDEAAGSDDAPDQSAPADEAADDEDRRD